MNRKLLTLISISLTLFVLVSFSTKLTTKFNLNIDECTKKSEVEEFKKAYFPFEFKNYSTVSLLKHFKQGTVVDSILFEAKEYEGEIAYKIFKYKLNDSYISFLVKEESEYFYLIKAEIKQDLFKPKNGCEIGIKTKSFHKLVKSELTNCNPFYLSEGDLETVYQFNFIKGRLQSININISPDYDKFENNIEGKIDYNKTDDNILSQYVRLTKELYINAQKISELSNQEIDSIMDEQNGLSIKVFGEDITYSPDSVLKFFTITEEGCGAYCNDDQTTWIHYKTNKDKIVIRRVGIGHPKNIFKIENGKYLIIGISSGRPASVLTVYCNGAYLIALNDKSIKIQNVFSFCQENGVFLDNEQEPYIKYNEMEKKLYYLFGNNYAYSQGINVDTIRQGTFNYTNGKFQHEKEFITVNNYDE